VSVHQQRRSGDVQKMFASDGEECCLNWDGVERRSCPFCKVWMTIAELYGRSEANAPSHFDLCWMEERVKLREAEKDGTAVSLRQERKAKARQAQEEPDGSAVPKSQRSLWPTIECG